MHDRDHDHESHSPDELEGFAEPQDTEADDSGPDGQMSSGDAFDEQEEEQQIP